MAQYWIVCDSFDKVGIWLQRGTATADVVDDGGVTAIHIMPGTASINYFHVYPAGMDLFSGVCDVRARVRDASASSVRGVGSIVRAENESSAGTSQFQTNGTIQSSHYIGGALIGAALSNPSSLANNTYHWRGSELRVVGADTLIDFFVWSGSAADRPGTPLRTDTNPSGLNASGRAGAGGLGGANQNYYIEIIAVGTDGDPAPTGPVDVSEEPFRLRHHPMLNRVTPALSSPGVTDIGATSARPQVTVTY